MVNIKDELKADMAANPKIAEGLKGAAAARASAVAKVEPERRADYLATVNPKVPITPMFVIEGDGETIAQSMTFEEAQAEMQKLHEKRLAERAEYLDEEYIYFIKCRNVHPEGLSSHGIFLKSYPHNNIVRGDQWKSGYKPTFEQLHHGPIVCQVCLRYTNRSVPLDVTLLADPKSPAGTFEIDNRWLWKRPKKQERLIVEGETRAKRVSWTTGNTGVEEAEQRAVEAGLKVVN